MLFFGDVSGKGIPASMFMVRAISLARLLAREVAEPDEILARLNDELATDNLSGMFVTFLCAAYRPRSRILSFSNAGHCRPLLISRSHGPRWALDHLGTALGFETGLKFERTDVQLEVGDALVLYSDGVTEAFDSREECYGNDRLLADAALLAGQSASVTTSDLLAKVRSYAGGAPQSDDIAILTLVCGDAESELSLELHATPEEVMRAVEALKDFGHKNGLSEAELFPLTLALEECASNIVNHALRRDPKKTFAVSMKRSGQSLDLELRDCGPAFDPTGAPEKPLQADEDELPGGWGIQLVRRNVDKMIYSRRDGQNVLSLAKSFDHEANAKQLISAETN